MQATRPMILGLILLLVEVLGTQESGGGLRQLLAARQSFQCRQSGKTLQLAGLQCSVWQPASPGGPVPLVIFSHGFHGNRNQSTFLTASLARAGYLVLAPNHKDAIERGGGCQDDPSYLSKGPTTGAQPPSRTGRRTSGPCWTPSRPASGSLPTSIGQDWP